jgi:hypothetical protein
MSTHTITLQKPFVGLRLGTERVATTVDRRAKQVEKAKSRIAFVYMLPSVKELFLLPRDINAVIAELNSPEKTASWTTEDLRSLAHMLSTATNRLSKVIKAYREHGISDMLPYRWLLPRLSDRNDHLASIVEGLYMTISPDFAENMKSLATELRDTIDEAELRSPIAQMQG